MVELHFPLSAAPQEALGLRAIACGVSWRHPVDSDLHGMPEWYASTRADALSSVPWSDATERAFLDSQFSLQHGHVVSQIPDVDFWVIERHGQPIERCYVSRSDSMYVVNILLQPKARGLGLGSALTSDTLDQARTLGFGAMLHVLHQSVRAANLYRQLGFVVTGDSGTRAEMRWQATAV